MRPPCAALVVLQQTPGPFLKKLDESLLSAIPAFAGLTRPQIRETLDLVAPGRFNEGQTMFAEGMEADRFFLLLDGFVRVVRTTPGGDQIIGLHIPAGRLFGIAPALGRDTYRASAAAASASAAASETLALSWPSRLWHVFSGKYARLGAPSMKTLGARMEQLHGQIAALATQAVQQRVANVLLRMVNQTGRTVNQTGRTVDNGIKIAFPVTRRNISDIAGATLHTVSRLLSAWETDGIVQSTRRHVVLTAPHRLMLLSQPKT
jgi:CRP-like cAMP-binding protein